MKKAKNQYTARMLEYQKAKEASIKAEGDQHLQNSQHSNTSNFLPSSSVSGKMEKRKKQEDDCITKVPT